MEVTILKKNKKRVNKLFKGIYNFVDNYIVLPISKAVYIIGNKISKNNKLDKILNRPNTLIYVALALSLIIFFLVDTKTINLTETNSEILADESINVLYNSSAYVVEGLPDAVDIILTGRKSDLYLANRLGDHLVTLDLSDLEASDEPQTVKLTYNQPIDSLDYTLVPSEVTVTIKKKVSDIKSITYDILNQDQLDEKLSVENITLSKNEVVVKGSEDTLNKIASVKALIDLENNNFTEKGTYTLDNVKLVAYDDNGKILEEVEIVSTSVSADIELDSYSKEVPINIITTGTLVTGKSIESIKINGESNYQITIYGDRESIDQIESVPVTINVDGQGNTASITRTPTIGKQSGVRHISDSSVEIELTFGEAKQKTIENVGVEMINVPTGLTVNAKSVSEENVDIQIIGVQSVIDNITAADIDAYIDLTGYPTGEHTIEVYIRSLDPRIQYIASDSITVIITRN